MNENNVAETSTCTIIYFNKASVLCMFFELDIRGINNIRLISRPIDAPSHELEDRKVVRVVVYKRLNNWLLASCV